MKKKIFFITLIELLVASIYYYIALPPINITSREFWSFVMLLLVLLTLLITLVNFSFDFKTMFTTRRIKNYSKGILGDWKDES